MQKVAVCFLCLLLVAMAGTATAGVIHVPLQYAEIHDAVQACAYGDTVLVDPGTYHDCTHETEGPGSTPACVIMKSGVTLRGSGVDATIIDAQAFEGNDGRGIFVELVSDCRIENLQVTGCYAEVYGAGILVRQVDSSVEVTDVKIFDNGDGGIICINSSHPTLTRVDFIDNAAKLGGGLSIEENSNATVTDCFFDNNTAPAGGGLMIRINSNPVFSGCTVQNNYVSGGGDGGGIAVVNSSPTFTDCHVLTNTAPGSGGGFFYSTSGGSMTDCVVQGNTVTGGYSLGAGIYATASGITMTNVLIAENTTTGFFAQGGGMYCAFAPSPSLEHCTISDNACGGGGAGGGILCDWSSIPDIHKCIIAFSSIGQGMFCQNGAVPTVSCTNLFRNKGGDLLCGKDNGGNFSYHPRFCETVGVEYYLGTNSSCAPGNHPDGPTACDGDYIGAYPVGCGFVGVEDTPTTRTALLGNAPNPFNPQTHIFFVLAEDGPATLRIYDARGHSVRTLLLGDLALGSHDVLWDGRNDAGHAVASGVYFYTLRTQQETFTQRMALIR